MGLGQGELRRSMSRLPEEYFFQAIDQFVFTFDGGH